MERSLEKKNSKKRLDEFLNHFSRKSYSLVGLLCYFLDKSSEFLFFKIIDDLQDRTLNLYHKVKNTNPGEQRAKSFQAEIEAEMKLHDLSNVSCGKGCSHCCHWKVEITEDEAEVLANLLRKKTIKVNMNRLKELSQFDNEHPIWKTPSEKTKCIFLDEAGACGVYEDRPVSCRKCVVQSDPSECKVMQNNKVVPVIIPEIEVITSLTWSLSSGDVNTLPHLVWKKLNEQKK